MTMESTPPASPDAHNMCHHRLQDDESLNPCRLNYDSRPDCSHRVIGGILLWDVNVTARAILGGSTQPREF